MKKYTLLLLLMVTACGHVDFDPPKGFVETRKSGTILKMVAADASAMKVSYRENKKNGTADFWATLMVRELVEFKGYKLLKKSPFKGKSGYLLEFKAPYKHKDFNYSVGVLAGEDDIYIVELGCEGKAYATHKPRLISLMKKVYGKLD